jgi:O-antigen ligase
VALPFFPRTGVVGLVLLFPLIPRFIPRAGPALNAATALFPLAVLAGLLYSRPALPRLKVLAPFLAYYALTLIGYAVLVSTADVRDEAFYFDTFEALKARLWSTLLFFAGFALAPDPAMRLRLMTCMVIGLLPHSFSGIYDYATGGAAMMQPAPVLMPGEIHRAAGVLDANPNILGGHLAAFSVLALMGMTRRESAPFLRGLCAATYAISGMVLVLTQSRGAWLAFIVGHSVWLFYTHRKLLLPAMAAFAVISVAAYSASLLPEPLSKRISETLTPGTALFARQGLAGHFDSSVNARVAVTLTAVSIFAESPIWGHGFGSFRMLALEHGSKHGLWGLQGVSSESVLLNAAVEAGVIGLLIYGWLFWALISPGLQLVRRQEERTLGIALLAVFASIFVNSLTQVALFLPEIVQGFWLLAGMATRASEEVHRSSAGR